MIRTGGHHQIRPVAQRQSTRLTSGKTAWFDSRQDDCGPKPKETRPQAVTLDILPVRVRSVVRRIVRRTGNA